MATVMNVPAKKPQLSKEEAINKLAQFDLSIYPVKLLGIRGYYKTTMGNPLSNDRGIYDDAIFIVANDLFKAFNANTDPSVRRPNIAVLKSGKFYTYRIGLHGISRKNPYEALRQHSDVTVIRDNRGEFTDSAAARFWINIHRGGYNTTSSLGCQTIFPSQWNEFMLTVKTAMLSHSQSVIPYALIDA